MKSKLRYVVLSFCLLFAARLGAANSRLEADSTKSKYALNDPRNPACPCHQYQAQADKEYAKLLQKSGQGGKLQKEAEALVKTKKPGKVRSRKWGRDKSRCKPKQARQKKRFADRLSRCFHF